MAGKGGTHKEMEGINERLTLLLRLEMDLNVKSRIALLNDSKDRARSGAYTSFGILTAAVFAAIGVIESMPESYIGTVTTIVLAIFITIIVILALINMLNWLNAMRSAEQGARELARSKAEWERMINALTKGDKGRKPPPPLMLQVG